jgi:4'-phosphopantetheinyl transferase
VGVSAKGVAHLACASLSSLEAGIPDPCSWLSPAERARLESTGAPLRRRQFVAARWLARQVLSQAFGGVPRDWSLDAPAQGAPGVQGPKPARVSISHSGEWVAVACRQEAVGIDLEAPRKARDIEGLAQICCTPQEQRLLRDAAHPAAFFHELWTVKESWLKCRGEGVAPSRLVQLQATPHPDGAIATWQGDGWWMALCGPATMYWWSPAPRTGRRWQVRDLRPA